MNSPSFPRKQKSTAQASGLHGFPVPRAASLLLALGALGATLGAARAAAADQLVAQLPLDLSEGCHLITTQALAELCGGLPEGCNPNLSVNFEPITAGDVGTTIWVDATTDPHFDNLVALLTNGVNDPFSTSASAGCGGGIFNFESFFFATQSLNGFDLTGFSIDRIGFRVDAASFVTPGRNLDNDGIWTDLAVQGEFLFEGACATPPKIATAPPVTVDTCSTGAATVTLSAPAATAGCNASPTVSGSVISTSPPTPIVNGQVTLLPGTYSVQWTANDGSNTATSTQTVTILPSTLLANGQLLVRDRATVRTVANGFSAVGNAGAGLTQIGNGSGVGNVLSVAPVTVLDRATVQGAIRSSGGITLGHSDSIVGPIVPFAAVSLPAVPSLAGIVFPPSTGDRTFNPGVANSLAPASYGSVTVNSGATVDLVQGTYFFQALTVNAGSTLTVPAAGVRMYVANQLALQAVFTGAPATIEPVFLGFAGTSPVVLNAPFVGTLVAPEASLSLGGNKGVQYRGGFFARTLEVLPDVQAICDPSVVSQ